MSKEKYNLPKTEKELSALLKDLLTGRVSVDDLVDDSDKITVWRVCKDAPGYMVALGRTGETRRITTGQYEREKKSKHSGLFILVQYVKGGRKNIHNEG